MPFRRPLSDQMARPVSKMCLNSGTPETPDDAQESRTVFTKKNESHPTT